MRNICITGITRGLGKAMASEFAASGHRIIGCGRSQNALDELQSQLGDTHRFACLDVSNDQQVAAWADEIDSEDLIPDLLINNAAVINKNAPLWEVSAAEFNKLTSININGTANVIRHFLPLMIQREHGIVVNFSSGWGRSVSSGVAPYCGSKWAIEGMTQALAEDLPAGLAAIPLNPGVIHTDMLQSCLGPEAANYPSSEQWATLAVPFLLSLDANDNGHPLTVPMP